MKYTSINRGIPAGNPIANALVIIVGALAIGASIVLGFFAFIVLASIVLVLGAIIGLRVWWLMQSQVCRSEADKNEHLQFDTKMVRKQFFWI